ncbi:MAG: hypothetical protein ACK4IZ_03225 [Flavobacterium sp.]|uniref:hypothetical protein n=1 Tax=Flavobacterium sp. TaxID=239 RepID=UPI00391B09EF
MKKLTFNGLGIPVSAETSFLDTANLYQDLSPRAQTTNTALPTITPVVIPYIDVAQLNNAATTSLSDSPISPKVVSVITPKPSAATSIVITPKPSAATSIVTTPKTTALMTLKTVVADKNGVLPLVTVQINDKKYATTEAGVFQKTDVNPNDTVTISYMSYAPFTAKASEVPEKVILVEQAEQLNDAIVKNNTKKTNWWPLLGLGALAAWAASSSDSSDKKNDKKPVRAKI